MFKSATFEIVGEPRLACEGCEQRVERLLKAVPGVGQVRAHASNQRIDVLFDGNVLNTDAIAERVAKAGYQTRVLDSTTQSGS